MSTAHITNQDLSAKQELEPVLLKLLNCIRTQDPETYKQLVLENLTCIEPETNGLPVEGLPFHLFWLNEIPKHEPFHMEIVNPTYRVYGDIAYATYSLLTSKVIDGIGKVTQANETRIFKKVDQVWKMAHFHRS